MTKHRHSTPRDVFVHLLAIIMLTVSVVSIATLLFQYINLLLPDELSYMPYRATSETIRATTASLIIAWPVYLYLMRLLGRDVAADATKKDVWPRRWLFNLALFVSALAIIIDLITLVSNFLGGELTGRFFLKVVVVLVTAGSVFGYYLWDLKYAPKPWRGYQVPKLVAGLASAVLFVPVVAGFFIAGTPAEQRALRLDDERVHHLQQLQYQITEYWRDTEELPATLAELVDDLEGVAVPRDPETDELYAYEQTGDLSFQLCATFGASTPKQYSKVSRYDAMNESWEHEAGYECFERTINPDRHKDDDFARPNSGLLASVLTGFRLRINLLAVMQHTSQFYGFYFTGPAGQEVAVA